MGCSEQQKKKTRLETLTNWDGKAASQTFTVHVQGVLCEAPVRYNIKARTA